MNEVKYHSRIEEYWFTEQYKEFEHELKNYIGYITRLYFPGFRQSVDLYKDLRDNIVADIYCFLKGGHYLKTVVRITEEGKQMEFTSYLFTQIRGELTKFFNKYNRKRKREVSYGLNLFEFPIEEDYDLTEINLINILREHKILMEDHIQDLVFYLRNGFSKSEFKNPYQIKTICWILADEINEKLDEKKVNRDFREKELEEIKKKEK